MAFTKTLAVAVAAVAFSAGGALAWDDAYTGDATHNPNSNVLIHAYPASANYCPNGLQPVSMGGVICCGTPNAGAYVNRAGGAPRYSASVYAPEGTKGVVRR